MIVTSGIPHFKTQTAMTMGNFDGLHRGHMILIDKLVRKASEHNLTSVVITFNPHPQDYFNPHSRLLRITDVAEMVDILESKGVQYLVQLEFTSVFARKSAESFWNTVLKPLFNPGYIIVGKEHLFGSGRTGTPEMLKTLAAVNGIETDIEPQLVMDEERVSSTRIRNLIRNGEILQARRLLGHGLLYTGIVEAGAGRGMKLGFPTANLRVKNRVLPPSGVYVSNTRIDHNCYQSLSYIGKSPTFNGTVLWLETHVIDFSESILGKRITVDILEWIRDEVRFEAQTDLIHQMEQDLISAKTMLPSPGDNDVRVGR